jgi:hypothetical protein
MQPERAEHVGGRVNDHAWLASAEVSIFQTMFPARLQLGSVNLTCMKPQNSTYLIMVIHFMPGE